jgi:hypothetical protein
MSGYLDSAYAESLNEFGTPLSLPGSGGWLLKRQIPDTTESDAMGCYPLFACRNWSELRGDLQKTTGDLVSLCLVTDPFGDYNLDYLSECFPDVVKPFKEHYVADLEHSLDSFIHPHHRRNATKALQQLEVVPCNRPIEYLNDWATLYRNLIERHAITGLTAFSHRSFAEQLQVAGIVAFRALEKGSTVGMLLWYEQGDCAYYHLGAYSQRGYELGASFALFDVAIKYFAARGVLRLTLGAGAGINAADSGLDRFKQGWSTETRTVYFCGKIFDRQKYEALVAARDIGPTGYFPAYRLGEFT